MSKAFFDGAYYCNQKPTYLGQFSNDINGFKEFVCRLKEVTNEPMHNWFVCFENTGVYSKELFHWLVVKKIPCKEENALKISKSLGMRRGKNDKTDACDICNYAFEKRDKIEPSVMPSSLIINLKKLLSRRDLLVRHRQSIAVSLKEQRKILAPDLLQLFDTQNKEIIQKYTEHIEKIEELIQELMQTSALKINSDLAQSVVGVGPIIAAYMIAYTENFKCFKNARKFASYIGIAPFSNSSGIKVGKTKVSHLANKKIKSLFSNGAAAAILYDLGIKKYYKRKLLEGKHKGQVINAVKNKIVQRVFAVIARQQPYVKLSYV